MFSGHALFFLANIVSLWLFESACKYYQLLVRRVSAPWLCTNPSTMSAMTSLSCQLDWIWSQLGEDKPVGTPRRGFLDRLAEMGRCILNTGNTFGWCPSLRRSKGKSFWPARPPVSLGSSSTLWMLPPTSSTDIRTQSSAFYVGQRSAGLQEHPRHLVPDQDCWDVQLVAEQPRGSQAPQCEAASVSESCMPI